MSCKMTSQTHTPQNPEKWFAPIKACNSRFDRAGDLVPVMPNRYTTASFFIEKCMIYPSFPERGEKEKQGGYSSGWVLQRVVIEEGGEGTVVGQVIMPCMANTRPKTKAVTTDITAPPMNPSHVFFGESLMSGVRPGRRVRRQLVHGRATATGSNYFTSK